MRQVPNQSPTYPILAAVLLALVMASAGYGATALDTRPAASSDTAAAQSNQNESGKKFQQNMQTCERLIREQRLREAIPHAREAYELSKQAYGEADERTLASGCNYGRLLLATGDTQTALPVLRKNLRQFEQRYGSDAPELIDPLMDLAHASSRAGASDRLQLGEGSKGRSKEVPGGAAGKESLSQHYFDRAIRIARKHKGDDAILVARLNLEAGISLLSRSNPRGLTYVSRAHDIYRVRLGDRHPSTAVAAYWIGKGKFAAAEYLSAIDWFNTALAALEKPEEPSNPVALSSHALLVEAYEETGQSDLATKHCEAIGKMVPWNPNAQPQPLFKRQAEYPPQEKLNGREGEVTLRFTIDSQGFVRDARVVKLQGSREFSKAALAALARWRFAPRFENGKPVDTPDVKYLMRFRLKG